MNDVRIYAADVSPLFDKTLFERHFAAAPPERQQKILSYRYEKDAALCLGAWLLLSYASKHELGRPSVRITEDGNGKPFSADTAGWFFSLSHSGHYAVCATGCTELGADIQAERPVSIALARRCLCSTELAQVICGEQIDEGEFCRLWALKESYMKALGAGLRIDPRSFDVTAKSISSGGHLWNLRAYDSVSGYKIAVCAENSVFPESIKLLDLTTI